jgi:hypothetical protein
LDNLFKHSLLGILVFLLLGNLMVNTVIYVNYAIDKDFIVQNLCEQKNEVVNECQGNCFLEKQLDSTTENSASDHFIAPEKTIDLFTSPDYGTVQTILMEAKSVPYQNRFDLSTASKHEIFVPPEFL